MTATRELPAADPAAGETAVIAQSSPDDEDPRNAAEAEAAEAARCRESARLARDLAARVLAEGREAAEAEATRIITEAAEEAARLTAEADESDADGAWHELQARLLPEAAAARCEISGIREHRAALAARVPEIQAEQADAEQRLAALAGRRAEQAQWRDVARHAADVDAIKAAAAEESAITEAESAQRARVTAAVNMMAEVAAVTEAARQQEEQAAARLADLERQLDGYLPVAERDRLADKIASAAWSQYGTSAGRSAVLAWCSPAARHAVLSQVNYGRALACCAQALDDLCQKDPGAFDELVGIFLGPIALVVALVVQHWKLIEHYFQDGVQAVEKALSWFTGLAGRFRGWVGGAASAVASEGGKILRWFTELPGKVVSEVEKIATDLFTSGEHIIESLANGISSAASGALHSAMSFVGNTVKSFLPFSPAKQGPLSGAGDPGNSGRSIVGNLARGITAATPQAAAAALKMAGTVHAATSGLSATGGSTGIGSSLALSATSAAKGGGGNAYITVDVHGNTIMSDSDVNRLVAKVGAGLVKSLAQAGYKSRLT